MIILILDFVSVYLLLEFEKSYALLCLSEVEVKKKVVIERIWDLYIHFLISRAIKQRISDFIVWKSELLIVCTFWLLLLYKFGLNWSRKWKWLLGWRRMRKTNELYVVFSNSLRIVDVWIATVWYAIYFSFSAITVTNYWDKFELPEPHIWELLCCISL